MNMIKLSVLKTGISGILSVGHPNIFGCLGYIVSCGYPARTHTRGNSVTHVCPEVLTQVCSSTSTITT